MNQGENPDDVAIQEFRQGRAEGYASGLKEGERRERRALKRWLRDQWQKDAPIMILVDWLAARSKAAKTRER